MTHELYNGHVILTTNLSNSNRIIPSGSDMFVEKRGTRFLIKDLRKDFPAEKCGLKIGMQLVSFNGKDIEKQLGPFLPQSIQNYDKKVYAYALNMLFAGTHDKQRVITILENGKERHFYPEQYPANSTKKLLAVTILKDSIGYIKINNSLGNNDLVSEFDYALNQLMFTKKLVLDLTETPNGGNTSIAEPILSRFIKQEMPYQKHVLQNNKQLEIRSWEEKISPREKIYEKPLFVMVGHWTGSMGEGMAIGLDGMKRGLIVGTPMAGLIGSC